MARVEVARAVVADLDRMISSLALPDDTRARVRRSLRILEDFPRAGRVLDGRWSEFRFWLGPWPWMIFVYELDPSESTATVVAVHDARSSTAAR